MSEQKEKYTIEQETIAGGGFYDDGFIVLKDGKFFCETNSKADAELVCRLLNENENRVEIDKDIKEDILKYLQNRLRNLSTDFYELKCKSIDSGLKTIKQLKEM